MEYNECLDLTHEVQRHVWIKKIFMMLDNGQLSDWVSKFHPGHLHCRADDRSKFINGGYNMGQKFVFEDGSAWFLRFVQKGSVCDKLADEKVAMEVETLTFIKQNTDIPVPTIRGWGLAVDNSLGLGPFIIMDFIEGVSLESILKEKPDKRLMKSDISDTDIEYLYKQLARILLKLFQLDFSRIGSLPTPVTNFQAPIRPLTFKVHDIIQMGGVDTFGDRNQGFASTTEFFQYVFGQDWEQLIKQKNSVCGKFDAKNKIQSFSALRTLIPEFIHKDYDEGPFKLICEDFGLANTIVRGNNDLTIVGVIDLEWSYAGPAQLAASPWWLLQSRLTLYDLEFKEEAEKSAMILDRYLRYLDIFNRVLKEEERDFPTVQNKTLSSLVEWSQRSGAMWLHMLLHTGFNYVGSIPFAQLRKHIGTERWQIIKGTAFNAEILNLNSLAEEKVIQLEKYDEALEKINILYDKFDIGEITAEEYLETATVLCKGMNVP